MAKRTTLEGLDRVYKLIKRAGDVSQRSVQLAARKGAVYAQKQAKTDAPVDTGNLKKGIKIYGERSRYKGKKVYMVAFTYSMNDIFQKFNRKAQAEKAKGKKVSATAYYPASQEYGWILQNGRKMPAKHFLRNAVENHRPQIERIIKDELEKQLEKVIK